MNEPVRASSQHSAPGEGQDRRLGEQAPIPRPPEHAYVRSRAVRWTAAALLSISITVLACSLVVGAYNLRYSYRRITAIASPAPVNNGASLPASLPRAAAPKWVRPFLQDLSLVSPGLVVFTTACMSLAAFFILWFPAASLRQGSPHFPFPAGYKTYYVQFGLLGTIVGFVIAFSDIDLGAERQTMVLIEALGTALWSTLTALLLSYGICPVVEIAYQALRRPLASMPTDTRSALTLLRERTADAADSLATLRDAANAASAELSLRQLESRLQRLEGTLARLVDDFGTLAATATELGESQRRSTAQAQATATRLREVDLRLGELDRAIRSVASNSSETAASVEQIKDTDLRGHMVRIDELDRRIGEMITALRKALA